MWYYFAEIAILSLLIILIKTWKVSTKNGIKDLTRSIIVAVVSVIVNIVISFLFNIIMYFVYDVETIYMAFVFLLNILEMLIPFLAAYLITKFLGCNRKIGIIISITLIIALVSGALMYLENSYIMATWDIEETGDLLKLTDTIDLMDKAQKISIARSLLNLAPTAILGLYSLGHKGDMRIKEEQ